MFLDFITASLPAAAPVPRRCPLRRGPRLFAGHLRYRRRAIAAGKRVKTSSRLLPTLGTAAPGPRDPAPLPADT